MKLDMAQFKVRMEKFSDETVYRMVKELTDYYGYRGSHKNMVQSIVEGFPIYGMTGKQRNVLENYLIHGQPMPTS